MQRSFRSLTSKVRFKEITWLSNLQRRCKKSRVKAFWGARKRSIVIWYNDIICDISEIHWNTLKYIEIVVRAKVGSKVLGVCTTQKGSDIKHGPPTLSVASPEVIPIALEIISIASPLAEPVLCNLGTMRHRVRKDSLPIIAVMLSLRRTQGRDANTSMDWIPAENSRNTGSLSRSGRRHL